jgi:hypothetical protein
MRAAEKAYALYFELKFVMFCEMILKQTPWPEFKYVSAPVCEYEAMVSDIPLWIALHENVVRMWYPCVIFNFDNYLSKCAATFGYSGGSRAWTMLISTNAGALNSEHAMGSLHAMW